MIKEPTQQEEITFINIYTPNKSASEYIKQILIDLMGEVDDNAIITRVFNNPHLHLPI